MRFFLFFIILTHSFFVFATNARVLIDENSLSKEISGEWTLSCIKAESQKKCDQLSKKFPTGKWRVGRYMNGLEIKNLVNNNYVRYRGDVFRFQGLFEINNKPIQDLYVYFSNKDSSNDSLANKRRLASDHSINFSAQWVLHLPIDQYLFGVMTSEVPASWPLEALKAQAIASRTYFLHKKIQRMNEKFDVRADTLDQVYTHAPQKFDSIVKAVEETSGQVLVTKDEKQIFPAYFHSDCGGQTSNEKNVWRHLASQNEVVKDPYCQTASKNNWSFSMPKKELMFLLQKALYLPKDVELNKILPRLSEESRAYVIDLLFSGNLLKRVSGNDLRKVIGFEKLKSTQFEVSHYWDQIEFKGRGFGHGVGLCQWGAQRWARKGETYDFILNHYYPNSKIKTLNASHLKIYQANLVD